MESKPLVVYIVGTLLVLAGLATLVWGGADAKDVAAGVVFTALGGIFGAAVVQRGE